MNYDMQLEWIQTLHRALRSRPMDLFFLGWDYVDSMGFVILVVSFVLFLCNRKVGLKIFYIFAIGVILNILFKNLFALPRPCQIDLSVGLRCSTSYGFPSGGAESALLYAGVLWIECKKASWRIAGIIFALILSFSRVYLGLHYFTDILGGWALAALLLAVYYWVFPKCEKQWKLWAFLIPLVPLIVLREQGWFFLGILLGAALGLLFKLKVVRSVLHKSLQATVTAGGGIGLFLCSLKWPQYTFFFSLLGGFWLMFLGAYIATPLKAHS